MSTYEAQANGGSTTYTFENELAPEMAALIVQSNPGYMGCINLCAELHTHGVPMPVSMKTSINVHGRETPLDPTSYWPA